MMVRKTKTPLKSSPTGSDQPEENGSEEVLFWINKSGFPITDHVWNRMFEHAGKIHPAGESGLTDIRNPTTLPPVAIPKPPLHLPQSMQADKKVEAIQNYMCELQYNHTGTQFFDIKKYKSLNSLGEVAREMIKEALPIKCLEAVILGIYLTNGITGLERYPLSFRSAFGSNVHQHVVLVVSWNGLFGALGMSRREDLMYKPLQFTSLSSLIVDYIESYNQYWHKVNKVKIGFPTSHDPQSHETIHWKGLTINPSRMTLAELRQSVDRHAKDIRTWVRQAPIGATYAPRSLAPRCPSPTLSSAVPSKTRSSQSMSSSKADRSTTSISMSTSSKPTTPHQKQGKSFEMRI